MAVEAAVVAASAVAEVVASAVAVVVVASVEVVAVAGVVASVEAGVVAVAAEEELLLLLLQPTKDQCKHTQARKSPSEEMNFRFLRSDLLWV